MTRAGLLVVALAVCAPSALAESAPAAQAAARKPTKKKPKKPKKPKKKRERKRAAPEEPASLATLDITVEPPVASPHTPGLGQSAGVPDPPRPTAPPGGFDNTPVATRSRDRGPSWFIGVRGGPSLIDRRGFYEFRSSRGTYGAARNLRGELAFGRYIGRHVAFGIAAGGGPFPQFFAPAPGFGDTTRFSVRLSHARLDLELHRGWFVLAIGGGGAYEYATGTFGAVAPDRSSITMHTATFERFGVIGAARTGIELSAPPFAFEVLAEASALKLFRGTYEDGITGPGPSTREMGYVASLLLGVRLQ
jgi:hypothetical protein